MQKSSVFIARTTDQVKEDICALMGISLQERPVKYLGVPLIFTRLKYGDCEELKNKILSKITSWHSKLLSYAGRIQLIISILSSIHNYWSRIFVLPKRILKDIDGVMRRFMWGGVDMRRTSARVAWSEVCLPKKGGGLGIPNIFYCNKASMARHLWDLASKKDTFWVKWCHIYMLRNQCLWSWQGAIDTSWTWLKLMKLRDSFHFVIKVRFGNGENTFTWWDNWHSHGPLVDKYGARIMYDAASEAKSKVKEFMTANGWQFPSTSANLRRSALDLPPISDAEDCVI